MRWCVWNEPTEGFSGKGMTILERAQPETFGSDGAAPWGVSGKGAHQELLNLRDEGYP